MSDLLEGSQWRYSEFLNAVKKGKVSGVLQLTAVDGQRAFVTFTNVVGADQAKLELQEVVDFLKNPDKYTVLGAKILKGCLLGGPPGTGKALLAWAVAGEAGVPFFSCASSKFVELFVGVGSSRVRDLFEKAKSKATLVVLRMKMIESQGSSA